ncbi:hypothetical protein [Lacinutrix salivirga]
MYRLIFTTLLTLCTLSNNVIAQSKDITIYYEKNNDNSISFYYEKEYSGSIYLTVELKNLQNTSKSDFNGLINRDSGSLFNLRPINTKKNIGFGYKYSYIKGIPNSKFDRIFVYSLPFDKGKTLTVVESQNLKKSTLKVYKR